MAIHFGSRDVKKFETPLVHDLCYLLLLTALKTGDKALQLPYQPVLSISLSEQREVLMSGYFDIKSRNWATLAAYFNY